MQSAKRDPLVIIEKQRLATRLIGIVAAGESPLRVVESGCGAVALGSIDSIEVPTDRIPCISPGPQAIARATLRCDGPYQTVSSSRVAHAISSLTPSCNVGVSLACRPSGSSQRPDIQATMCLSMAASGSSITTDIPPSRASLRTFGGVLVNDGQDGTERLSSFRLTS
jgi:hypothetical protein